MKELRCNGFKFEKKFRKIQFIFKVKKYDVLFFSEQKKSLYGRVPPYEKAKCKINFCFC